VGGRAGCLCGSRRASWGDSGVDPQRRLPGVRPGRATTRGQAPTPRRRSDRPHHHRSRESGRSVNRWQAQASASRERKGCCGRGNKKRGPGATTVPVSRVACARKKPRRSPTRADSPGLRESCSLPNRKQNPTSDPHPYCNPHGRSTPQNETKSGAQGQRPGPLDTNGCACALKCTGIAPSGLTLLSTRSLNCVTSAAICSPSSAISSCVT
jgi:hypothetical protein